MFSFRQKIFISYGLVFLFFLAILFPIASQSINKIVIRAMEDRADELIEKIRDAPNDVALIRQLKDQKYLIFFRVAVLDNECKVLYDTHMKRLLGPKFRADYVLEHPEIQEAVEEGIGYHEEYSEMLAQKFTYLAKAFDFHGKTYLIRMAFPYQYVSEFKSYFEVAFLALLTVVLLLFSLMTWLIIYRLSRPIHQIIHAIKPYQEGKVKNIPEIILKDTNPNDDFGRLAITLNMLSKRIRSHIDSLTLERNEKEAVLESLVEGVVAVDASLQVIYANNMALQILGLKHAELVGHNFAVANLLRCSELLKSCQEEKRALTDNIQINLSGNTLFIDIVAAPKKENEGAILVLQDKTPHYKLLEMRKDFIANASHELKTPVTVVQGFAETLHDHPELPETVRLEVTSKIVRNCQKMSTLIRNLLTLADIENLPFSNLLECDMKELVLTCKENLSESYPQAQLSLEMPENSDVILYADPELVELSIMNLLINAAKYSVAPPQIALKLEERDNWVYVSVSDKGIGIPPEDLEHICHRFYTVDKTRSRKMGGSGLGLSIVDTIMKKHCGKISVTSELGVGSTFTLAFPIRSE